MSKIGYIINESGFLMENVDIQEFKGSPDRVTGYGCLQTGNEKNRNGRMYKTEDLAREIAAPRQQELLSTGNLCAELGHPLSTELIRQQTIDPKNICTRFLKIWMEGDNVMATFQGTNNELGKAFDMDLRQGVKPAFSLRALGTVNATPQGAIVENLKMITYDYVIYPSHPHAYTKGVLNESASLLDEQTTSCFKLSNNNDATKSFITEFTNADVVDAIETIKNESAAIDYIKDKSLNFYMLKECFDLTKFDTIDRINDHQIALTEAGNATIIMNVEDYIAREIQNYV